MRIYITGICGLVGGYLRQLFLDEGNAVTGNDVHNPAELPGIDITDITEFDSYNEIFDRNNVDVVIHTAGRPAIYWAEKCPNEAFKLHGMGTLNVLEGIRRAKRQPKMVYLSSAEVYRLPNLNAEEAVPDPVNFYGLSKLVGEGYVSMYGERFGIRYSVLRPSAVYGKASIKGVPYDLTSPFKNGGDGVKLYTSPDSVIDYVYIADVARAVTMALTSEWDGVTANIASGDPIPVGEAYGWVCDTTGIEIPLKFTPEASNVAIRTVTNGKALEMGWEPEYGWKDGFKELLGS